MISHIIFPFQVRNPYTGEEITFSNWWGQIKCVRYPTTTLQSHIISKAQCTVQRAKKNIIHFFWYLLSRSTNNEVFPAFLHLPIGQYPVSRILNHNMLNARYPGWPDANYIDKGFYWQVPLLKVSSNYLWGKVWVYKHGETGMIAQTNETPLCFTCRLQNWIPCCRTFWRND